MALFLNNNDGPNLKMKIRYLLLIFFAAGLCCLSGCDRIYRMLQKEGAQERDLIWEINIYEPNEQVRRIQQRLKMFGYKIGNADGILGANTRNAIETFQKDNGLKPSRFVDRATWEKIMEFDRYALIVNEEIYVPAVQVAMKAAGFDAGSADGKMGPRTQEMLKKFQAAHGLKPDGKIGFQTLNALKSYLQPAEFRPGEK